MYEVIDAMSAVQTAQQLRADHILHGWVLKVVLHGMLVACDVNVDDDVFARLRHRPPAAKQ